MFRGGARWDGPDRISFALGGRGAEPAAEGSFEDDIICGLVLEWLITTLNQANPRYGRIFRLLYDGAARQEIADELGIERQAMLEDIKKIRGLVQPLVKDIF